MSGRAVTGWRSIPRFLRTIVHVPPRQLLRRAYLVARRRAADRLGLHMPPRATSPAPEISPDPPLPLFPPREKLLRDDGGRTRAILLAREVDLESPVDWHPASLDHLRLLHLHYMEYLEGATSAQLQRLVLDWIHANPRSARRSWFAAWNSYAISLRSVVWMQQYAVRGLRSERWAGAMADSIAEQVRALRASLETDIGGNHLLKNVKALLWAGRFFVGPESRRWTDTGRRLLSREIRRQVLDDGMHFERSPSYHLQALADLLECYALLPDDALRERLGKAVDRMAVAATRTTHPDGRPSLFSDGGLRMAYSPEACLRVQAELRERGRARQRVQVQDGAFALEHAGYFGYRRDDDLLLVDCGPIGPDRLPAHGHGDILAFEWSLGGHRLVVDTGVLEYAEGPLRDHCRATRAHNTVTVGGEDQAEFYGSFRVGRRPEVIVERWSPVENGFRLTGSHDGFEHLPGRPRHQRSLRLEGDTLAVEDVVEGGAGQPVEARLLLHPDWRVTRTHDGCDIRLGERRVALITPAALRIEEAPWFPDFGQTVPTRMIALLYGAAPCRGGFTLSADLSWSA